MRMKVGAGPVDDDGPARSTANGGVIALETQRFHTVKIMAPDGMVVRDEHGRDWVVTVYQQKGDS